MNYLAEVLHKLYTDIAPAPSPVWELTETWGGTVSGSVPVIAPAWRLTEIWSGVVSSSSPLSTPSFAWAPVETWVGTVASLPSNLTETETTPAGTTESTLYFPPSAPLSSPLVWAAAAAGGAAIGVGVVVYIKRHRKRVRALMFLTRLG